MSALQSIPLFSSMTQFKLSAPVTKSNESVASSHRYAKEPFANKHAKGMKIWFSGGVMVNRWSMSQKIFRVLISVFWLVVWYSPCIQFSDYRSSVFSAVQPPCQSKSDFLVCLYFASFFCCFRCFLLDFSYSKAWFNNIFCLRYEYVTQPTLQTVWRNPCCPKWTCTTTCCQMLATSSTTQKRNPSLTCGIPGVRSSGATCF